jgi:hypothetical protein
MATELVKASVPETGGEYEVEFDFGDNLEDMTEKFGAEAVFSNAKSQMRIRLQAIIRERAKKGVDISNLASWKPGVAMERALSPEAAKAAFLSKFKNSSQEERAAMLAELQAAAMEG